jgi:hypothetical protein
MHKFSNPSSIGVVVHAGPRRGEHNLLRHLHFRYKGAIYPINLDGPAFEGLTCRPALVVCGRVPAAMNRSVMLGSHQPKAT